MSAKIHVCAFNINAIRITLIFFKPSTLYQKVWAIEILWIAIVLE